MADIKDLLRDFYGKYAKEEISDAKIKQIESTYKGDYDTLIKDLYGKYTDQTVDNTKLGKIKTTYELANQEPKPTKQQLNPNATISENEQVKNYQPQITSNTIGDLPKVNVEGTWREGFEGNFNYDIYGYEYFEPTKEFVDSMGGFDNLAKYFEKEKPNTILSKPREYVTDVGGNVVGQQEFQGVNFDRAKPTNLVELIRVRELQEKPFDQWSESDKEDYYLAKMIEVNRANGNFVKKTDEEKKNEAVVETALQDKEFDKDSDYIYKTINGLNSIFKGIGKGGADFVANAFGIPEFLFDTGVSTVNGFGLDLPNYRQTFGEDVLLKGQKYLKGSVNREDLYNKVRYNEEGIWDSFKSGNVEQGINKTLEGIGGTIPYMVSMMYGNAGMMTAFLDSSEGQYVKLQEQNKDLDQASKILNSTIYGLAEVLPEKIGLNAMMKPYYRLLKKEGALVAENALEKTLRKYIGGFTVLTPHAIELSTEYATMLMQNYNAVVTREDPNRKLTQGIEDVTIQTIATSGVLTSPAQIANTIYEKSARKSAEKLLTENTNILNSISNGNISEESKLALTEKYLKNVQKVNNYIERQTDKKGTLNKKQKDLVKNLENQKTLSQNLLQEEGVTDDVKESVQEDIDAIDEQINGIIETSTQTSPSISQTENEVQSIPELDIRIERGGVFSGEFLNDYDFLAQGSEHTVYRSKDGKTVIKIGEPYNSNDGYQTRVDDALVINNLLGDGSLQVIGTYKSPNGTINPVYKQNFIEGNTATQEQVEEHLINNGFTKTGSDTFIIIKNGKTLEISDTSENFIVNSKGNVIAIDASIREIQNKTQENGVQEVVTKPTQEEILSDIQSGNTVTFNYESEDAVPNVLKDKISSMGETNGKKEVRVTLSKREADFLLQEQTANQKVTEEVVSEIPTEPSIAEDVEPITLEVELPKPDKAKQVVINNKIAKQKEALAKAVRESRKQANVGFAGVKVIKELTKLGALYLEQGTIKFSEWSKEIIKEYGSNIEQKDLVDLYKKAAKTLKVGVIDNTVKKRVERTVGVKPESKDETAFKQGNKQGVKEGKLEVQLNAQEKVDKVKGELQTFKDDVQTKFAEYTKFKTEENKTKLDNAKAKYADKLKQVKEKASQELKTFRDDVKTKFEEYNRFKNEQSKKALDNARQKAKEKLTQIRELDKERFTEKIDDLKEKFKAKILDIKTSDLKDRETIKEVRDFFSSFKKLGTFNGVNIPANIVEQVVKKLSTALASKDRITAMMDFSEYLEKIIDDVDRTKKENVARQQSNKIKAIANSSASKGQVVQNPILKAFARIGANPSKITDIDKYNEIAAQIDKNGITVSNKDLEAYVDGEVAKQEKIREDRAKEIADLQEAALKRREDNLKKRIKELLDEAGIEEDVEDFYLAETEYRDAQVKIEAEKEAGEVKETLTDKLKKVIEANRKGLPKDSKGLTPYEAQTLEALRGINLEGLTPTELKQINTAILNAVVNGDFVTATINITQKFIQEQQLPKWIKFYQDGLRRLKSGKIAGKIIQGTGKRTATLTPKTGRGNLNQIFRAITNSGNVGQELYNYVMGDIMRGKERAKQRLNRVKKDILKIVADNKLNIQNRTRVGAAGYLLNFELDGRWADKQEAFEAKKKDLEDSAKLLEAKIKQSGANLKKSTIDEYKEKLKDLNEALVEIRKYDDVETFQKEFLTPKERQLYDFIVKSYEDTKKATQQNFRKLGTKFTDSENYFPITFGGFTSANVSEQRQVGLDTYVGSASLDNEGGFVAERTRKSGLPKPKREGLVRELYIETDALLNFNREFGRRIIDLETIDARVRAKHFLDSKDLRNIMDGVGEDGQATIDNMTNIVEKVNETVADVIGTTPFSQDVDSIVQIIFDKLTTGFFNTALGSVSQLVSQSVPSIPVVIAQTSVGSWGAATQIQMQNTPLILDLMYKSNADAFGRLQAPLEQLLQDRVNKAKNEYQNGLLNTAQKIQDFANKINFQGLTIGDNINTSNAWMAGYIQYLKDNKLVDSKTKFDEVFMNKQVANPNLKAAAYADMTASTVNATMDTDTRATNLKKRTASGRALDIATGNVLKGFTTSFNFEAKLAVRSIFNGEGTAKDIKFLAAYGTSIFLLSSLTKLVLGALYENTVELVGGLFDDDEEKLAREAAERRSLEKLNIILTKEEKVTIRNMKGSLADKAKRRAELIKEKYEAVRLARKLTAYLTQGLMSVAMGSKQGLLRSGVEFGIDRIYNRVVESQFQEGFNAVEQKVSYAPQTLFFTSDDNIFGMGALDGFNESFKQLDKFSNGKLPLDEGLAKQLQTTRAFSSFIQYGLVLPFAGDVKRITDIKLRKLEELAKDGYYNMPETYGFVRDAINKYDLEPIKPYNTKELTLENKKGEVQVVKLNEDNLKKINEDAGTIIKKLMDMGRNSMVNLGTSLETFNKGNYPIEKLKTALDYRAKRAKELAVEKFINENYKGFKKISKQEEEEE